MFKNKNIILSGNNDSFNDFFLINYFKKAANITVVNDYLTSEFKGGDILFHYVGDELKKIHNYFEKDEDDFKATMAIKESIKNHIKNFVFLSDGTTSIQNEKMVKNLMLRFAKQNSKTKFLYVLVNKSKNYQQMVDFAIFALKNGKNGDIFIKKVYKRMTFADRLKSLIKSETKLQKESDSFFTSLEMQRSIDFGDYIRVPMESRILEEV